MFHSKQKQTKKKQEKFYMEYMISVSDIEFATHFDTRNLTTCQLPVFFELFFSEQQKKREKNAENFNRNSIVKERM